MGIQGAKSGKGDAETPDLTIRVRMLYKSDSTLHLSMILVVSRNGESSLIFSIIIEAKGGAAGHRIRGWDFWIDRSLHCPRVQKKS